MRRSMTIGELAEAAGVGVETVRYYQRRGLLPTPHAPAGRHRRYPAAMLEQIAFIKRAQEFGFTLDEIGAIQRIPDSRCADGREFAKGKLDELTRRVEEINKVRDRLAALVKQCETRGPTCPFLDALHGKAR